MNFGIATKNTDDARNEFLMVFGSEHLWFYDLFTLLRRIEMEEGIKFTDVLIKQGKPVMLGILKNFFSIKYLLKDKMKTKDADNTFFNKGLTELEIKDFVEKYITYKEGKLESQKSKIKHYNFSLNVYGLGCFRCNFSENDDGYSLNIRILDFIIPDIKTLLNERNPIDNRYLKFLEALIENKSVTFLGKNFNISRIKRGGLILHAGPTGSGKSTFIASELLFFANNISGLIITYEEPIEYRFTDYPKVLQVELGSHLEYNELYKHFLRNSPAIGAFHEIKTREEFLNVIDLASRGHLIFTTVHANNVKEVFSSFSFFDKDVKQLFSNVLLAIICHRLDLDKDGRIKPILEIFMNDVVFIPDPSRSIAKPLFTLYIDGEMMKLGNLLYVEKNYPYFFSFEEYLKKQI